MSQDKTAQNEVYLPLIISDLMYKSKICNELAMKLSNLNYYTKVIIIAQELFTQKDFQLKFDVQPELLGFNNGNYHLNVNRLRVPVESERVFMSVGYNYRSDKTIYRDEIMGFWQRLGLVDVLPILARLLHGNVRNPIIWINGLNDTTSYAITQLLNWTLGDYVGTLAFSALRKRKIPHIQTHTHSALVNNCCKRLIIVPQSEKDYPSVYQPMMDTLLNQESLNLRKPYESSNDYHPQFGIMILSTKPDSEPSPDAMVFQVKENLPNLLIKSPSIPEREEDYDSQNSSSEHSEHDDHLASSQTSASQTSALSPLSLVRSSSEHLLNHSNIEILNENDDSDSDDLDQTRNMNKTPNLSKDLMVKEEWKYEFIRILFQYLNK
jgi:hypothetical protein